MMRMRSSVLVLIACAALMGVTYVAILRPKIRQASDFHKQLVSLHAQSSDLIGLQDTLTAARLLLARAKTLEDNLRAHFLRKERIETFTAEIASLARRAGLADIQIHPSPVRPAQECDVVSFELRLTGRFPDLMRLLEAFSTTGIAYSVESIVIQTEPSTGQGVFHLTVETYLLKETPA